MALAVIKSTRKYTAESRLKSVEGASRRESVVDCYNYFRIQAHFNDICNADILHFEFVLILNK